MCLFSFFFHLPASTDIYTLSLHDALPIYMENWLSCIKTRQTPVLDALTAYKAMVTIGMSVQSYREGRDMTARSCQSRSEEHTSELQSRQYLVCRLLLEKKKKKKKSYII